MNKKPEKNNSIPVHFADDDTGDDRLERGEGEHEFEPEGDDTSQSSPGLSIDAEDATEEEADAQVDSRDEPVTMEGQDFEASSSDPPASETGSLRQTVESAATGPVLAELIATRAELRRVEVERADLREALARRQADFENFRKRVERERTDSYNRMVGDVVSRLLPVLDNLRRALEAEATLQANESEEFRHFLHGVQLIYRQLTSVLEGLGLQAIPAMGERFDPHVHEAVVTEHTDEYEPDTVIQEIVPGYRLGEKLLRPAIVKVATR